MENEKKSINTNETSLEQRDYSKEYWYLNQLKWKFDFNFYKNPILSESNFYSSIAWYIDNSKKENWNWEEKVQNFIDTIQNLNSSDSEKLLYADKILIKEKQKRYKENNMDFDFDILESISSDLDDRYKQGNNTVLCVTWIKSFMIPERYYWRFTESWLEAKVMNKNRENFVTAMKHWREKAEELKKKL